MTRTGYLYRFAAVSDEQVRALIAQHIGTQCWTFGGAALWDVNPADGTKNLRPIEWNDTASLTMTGDFGHAFNEQAEIRWRRSTVDRYDALLLTETKQLTEGAVPIGDKWMIEANPRLTIRQTNDYPPIPFVSYVAPNGAIQFVRYAMQSPKEQRDDQS